VGLGKKVVPFTECEGIVGDGGACREEGARKITEWEGRGEIGFVGKRKTWKLRGKLAGQEGAIPTAGQMDVKKGFNFDVKELV